MALLPHEDFTLRTPLSPQEVEKKLLEIVEPKSLKDSFFRFFGGRKAYSGTVNDNKFRIKKISGFINNSFMIIEGNIQPLLKGSSVEVKMRLQGYERTFMTFWLGFTAFMGIITSILFLFKPIDSSSLALPWILFIFGYSLSYINFKIASKKSKTFLLEYLKAYNP